MFRVIDSIAIQYDYRMILLSIIICVLSAHTAFRIYSFAENYTARNKSGWLFVAGVCAACGVWSTHFIAMLAFDAGVPTTFDPTLTIVSLFVAIPVTTLGFTVAAQGKQWQRAIGGSIIGIGAAMMSYTGMAALLVPGRVEWDPAYLIASLVIGCMLAAAATLVHHRDNESGLQKTAPMLLTLAICGMHFTGMTAIGIIPDPSIPFDASPLNKPVIAIAVAGVALLILLAGVSPARIVIHNSRQVLADKRLFSAALEHMSQGLSMFDENANVLVCNQRYTDMYGLPPKLSQPGTALPDILRFRLEAGTYYKDATLENIEDDYTAPYSKPDKVRELTDGRVMSISSRALPNGGWVTTHEDITARRRAEDKIVHMAHHDALTGLPNRVLFQQKLNEALARVRRGERLAVLCLDLDQFKNVNDTLGHPVGDKLLKVVGERLQSNVREIDTAARLGGDEFAIIQVKIEDVAEAVTMAKRLIETLSAPYDLGDHQVVSGTSIGIAIGPNDGDTVERLMKAADLALYRAKTEGRGTYCLFEQEMDDRMQARRYLELDLRKALVGETFELHYQPLINLETNKVCALEALVRWQHPERGMVPPDQFVPLAEDIGLIGSLGEWVLQQACTDAATWPDDIKIAVNLSALQFKNDELIQQVENALAQSKLPAARLELEITESVLMENAHMTADLLHRLRDFGIQISMDDFGTGYSSLSYLHSFPFDKIKIDRSFVSNLSERDDAIGILRAITALSGHLGMATTAEGVETEEELEIVRSEGCTEAQGYLFSPARPAGEVLELINALSTQRSREKVAA